MSLFLYIQKRNHGKKPKRKLPIGYGSVFLFANDAVFDFF